MNPPIIVVDRSDQPAQRGHYIMRAVCEICGESHVALLSKGQAPKSPAQLCPYCEIPGFLRYLPTREAAAMLPEGAYYSVWTQTPDDGIAPILHKLYLRVPFTKAALDDVLSGPRGDV